MKECNNLGCWLPSGKVRRKKNGKRHAEDFIVLVIFYYFLKNLIKMRNVSTMLHFLKMGNVD